MHPSIVAMMYTVCTFMVLAFQADKLTNFLPLWIDMKLHLKTESQLWKNRTHQKHFHALSRENLP